MSLWATLFGGSKNAETIVDGAVKGMDKLWFTDEEKNDAQQKLNEWYLRYLETTQPQNLARRLIAIIVVGVWALLLLFSVAMYKFDPGYSSWIFATMDKLINQPFMIIIGFYFLTQTVRAWRNGGPGD